MSTQIERCRERQAKFTAITGKRIMQVPDEQAVVYSIVAQEGPYVMLEVGSAFGGSLYVYAGALAHRVGITVIGIERRYAGPGPVLHALKQKGFSAHWLRMNAHAEPTLTVVKDVLGGRPVDFLHLDCSHSKKGLLREWALYGPLVRPGGVVVVHDIEYRGRGARVAEAWQVIRQQGRAWCDVVGTPSDKTHTRIGSGVLWK